jgi:Chalcone isomerase-like
MRRRDALIGLSAALGAASLRAQLSAPAAVPPEVAIELPGAKLQGSGRLNFLLLHVYDIRLWSAEPPGEDYARSALALELDYARALAGREIAERSIVEMRRIGDFDDSRGRQWLGELVRLFPDVKAGDRLTGVQRDQAARFHFNGQWRGELADADFTRLFFGIWLSPRTSEPKLRQALLGRT